MEFYVENDIKNYVGKKIVYQRLKQGLTQQQLADLVGLKRSNISRIENGDQNITIEMFDRICRALGLEPFVAMEEASPLYNNTRDYALRLYDQDLVHFSMERHERIYLDITWINKKLQQLFPVGLDLDDEGMLSWLRRRSLPGNREFVGQILKSVGITNHDIKSIVDVSLGLSLNDSYWIVPQDFDGKFADYNLYDNPFSRTLALVAYTGNVHSHRGLTASPELTTGGMLRKAWRALDDGSIWLYKGGTDGFANAGNEPYSEFYASQIAERMDLNAVQYKLENWKGIIASKCRLFTSKDISYVPVGHVVKTGGIEAIIAYYRELGEPYYQQLCSMLVFDAVIYNTDRHFGNFGLLRDNHSGEFFAPAPVFDNGLSLLCYAMKKDFGELEDYLPQLNPPYDMDFLSLCRKVMGPVQKKQLRRLINFRFEESDLYNLPSWRLRDLEELIQTRVQQLLEL